MFMRVDVAFLWCVMCCVCICALGGGVGVHVGVLAHLFQAFA